MADVRPFLSSSGKPIPPLKVVRTRGNVALEGGLGSRHNRKIPGSGGSEARSAFGMLYDRNASALAL